MCAWERAESGDNAWDARERDSVCGCLKGRERKEGGARECVCACVRSEGFLGCMSPSVFYDEQVTVPARKLGLSASSQLVTDHRRNKSYLKQFLASRRSSKTSRLSTTRSLVLKTVLCRAVRSESPGIEGSRWQGGKRIHFPSFLRTSFGSRSLRSCTSRWQGQENRERRLWHWSNWKELSFFSGGTKKYYGLIFVTTWKTQLFEKSFDIESFRLCFLRKK